jgi:hypothetical protein
MWKSLTSPTASSATATNGSPHGNESKKPSPSNAATSQSKGDQHAAFIQNQIIPATVKIQKDIQQHLTQPSRLLQLGASRKTATPQESAVR